MLSEPLLPVAEGQGGADDVEIEVENDDHPGSEASQPQATNSMEEGQASHCSDESTIQQDQHVNGHQTPASARSRTSSQEEARNSMQSQGSGHFAMRLKYYRRLCSHDLLLPDAAEPPRHVQHPWSYLAVTPFAKYMHWGQVVAELDPDAAQESSYGIARVFTIANVMLGSSMLVLPWAFDESGLVPGLLLLISIGIFCHYTSSLILKWSSGFDDFSDMCNHFLGSWAWHTSLVSSLLVLLGATCAYHTMMADFFHSLMSDAKSQFVPEPQGQVAGVIWAILTDRLLAPIPLAILLFPFTNVKEVAVLAKFTSWGILAVLMCFIYVVSVSLGLGCSTVMRHGGSIAVVTHRDATTPGSVQIPLANGQWGALADILPVSFFAHNLIIPIMQGGNESQQTKMKQHAAAFGLVGFIYLFVGGLPLLAVAGAMQDCLVSTDAGGCGEMAGCIWTGDSAGTAAAALAAAALGGGAEEGAGKCVQGRLNQNFLISDLQPWPSVWVSGMLHDVVRFAVLLQLITIYPLVCAVFRGQFFTYLLGNQYPGMLPVLALNIVVVSLATVVASVFPDAPGKVLAFAGAVTGTLYVCQLPILVHLSALRREGTLTAPTFIVHAVLLVVGTLLFLQGLIL